MVDGHFNGLCLIDTTNSASTALFHKTLINTIQYIQPLCVKLVYQVMGPAMNLLSNLLHKTVFPFK